MTERAFDVILFGATGFTGRLVAEYFLEHGPADLRWAMAGRSQAKLEAVRAELAELHTGASDIPLLVADAKDRAALDRVAAQTKVVCTTVGPYALYGEDLVGACAGAGTHYCDLTGETQFIRRMIDAHEETARSTGARIVHSCGFDSIPSDLGCLMMGDALQVMGARPTQVRFYAGESSGTASGGTVASLLNVLDEVKKDPSLRKVLGHPYGLNPQGERKGPDGQDQVTFKYDKDMGMWTAPFVMAGINTRIVRRSHALRGFPYGQDFRYSEVMSTGASTKGLARAVAITGALGGLLAGANIGPVRKQIEKRLPKPGEGPTKEQRENGFFVIRLLADGVKDGGAKVRLRGEVRGTKDPGYGETAKMLGESALCLAFDELPVEGGSWTPATAMGGILTDRLRAAGMTFAVKTSS